MKRILLIISLFVGYHTIAQSADFILLKKKNKTIATYFSGSNISFTATNGAYLNATITQIKNDSLFLRQYIVQQVPTRLGVYVLDTVTSYRYTYNYRQIKAIGRTGRKFNLSASSASLIGGGALLLLGSAVVYFADREKFSPQLMLTSAVLVAVGYVIAKTGGKGMLIGKKYKLVYVDTAGNKEK